MERAIWNKGRAGASIRGDRLNQFISADDQLQIRKRVR